MPSPARSSREICFLEDSKVRDTSVELGKDVFDAILALSSVGGDVEFLEELVGIVEAALPTLLRDIQKALIGGDLRVVEKRAHLMRAATQNVSAKRAFEAALALETIARGGDAEAARQAACALEEEINRLKPVIAAGGFGLS